MQGLRQWLVWRFEADPKRPKPLKVPYYVSGGKRVGTQGDEKDRKRLVPVHMAQAKLAAGEHAGLGFAFLPGDGLIGIDIDGAVSDDGEISPMATEIVERLASYTEWSPSRKGLHIIVRGETETFKSNDIGLEVFAGKQYFTFTGERWEGTPLDVQPIRPEDLAWLRSLVDGAKAARRNKAAGADAPLLTNGRPSIPRAPRPADDLRQRCEKALFSIPPSCGYNDWISIGWALRDAFGDAGFDLWNDWSRGSDKYPGEGDLRGHWKSFRATSKTADEALGVVFRRAMDAGWVPPKTSGRPARPAANSTPAAAGDPPPTEWGEGETAAAPSDSPPPPEGKQKTRGGGRKLNRERLKYLFDHFALVYGTDTCVDMQKRMLMKVSAATHAYGSSEVRAWKEDADRRMVLPTDVVFDPSTAEHVDGKVNLFAGWPLEPAPGDVTPWMDLLRYLMRDATEDEEEREKLVHWVLCWLAYPLKKPGVKLRTALVFHGEEGVGKNLLFESVGRCYGQYHKIVGQDELEDRFNDWRSCALYVVADEVVAAQELVHNKNRLKAVVTSPTVQINPKGLPRREERNQMNVVFLSNELKPLALDNSDRRYFVVWHPPVGDPGLFTRVRSWLEGGGAQALYHYLLTYDTEDYDEFWRPPMTEAKRRLIEMNRKSPDRFMADWLEGVVDLPQMTAPINLVYRAYLKYCQRTGERFPEKQQIFTPMVERFCQQRGMDVRCKVIKLQFGHDVAKATRCLRFGEPPEDKTEMMWGTECAEHFLAAFKAYMGEEHSGLGLDHD